MPKPLSKIIWAAAEHRPLMHAAANRSFRDMLSPETMSNYAVEVSQWLAAHGWSDGGSGMTKNGVYLLSKEGFQLDARAHSIHKAYELRLELAEASDSESSDQIDLLRLAYEAGLAAAESQHHQLTSGGNKGRPPARKAQFAALDVADRKWKKANAKTTRKPTASELKVLVMGDSLPMGSDAASKKTFANVVAAWRAARKSVT